MKIVSIKLFEIITSNKLINYILEIIFRTNMKCVIFALLKQNDNNSSHSIFYMPKVY